MKTFPHHSFRDASLLKAAITHPSVRAGGGVSDYQRLEFLGDRVLGLVVANMVFQNFPHEAEGNLALRHTALVRAETCADIAVQWQLNTLLDAASSEWAGGEIQNPATLADAAEAMIGAIYLDGGYAAAEKIIQKFWQTLLVSHTAPPQEPKTALQEWAQGRGLPLPEYTEVSRTGPDHAPEFTIQVSVKNHGSAQGSGTSRRAAEKAAAEKLLKNIG